MGGRAGMYHRDFRVKIAKGMMIGGIVALLAGCITKREVVDDYPNDYRIRHPIAIKERERTVEIFVGEDNGSLTALQRDDIVALARAWQREATGPLMID